MNGGRVALAGEQQSAHGRSQWARTAFVSRQPQSAPRATGCALIRRFAVSFSLFSLLLLLEPYVPSKHEPVFYRCRTWYSFFFLFTEKQIFNKNAAPFPQGCYIFNKILTHEVQLRVLLGTFCLVYFRKSCVCVCFCPIIPSDSLLCWRLSRFSLFGGCNAMPSVGSCCCWRPLGPNWISRGN